MVMRERINDYLLYIKFKVLQMLKRCLQTVRKLHIMKFWRYMEVNEWKFHGKVNRIPLYRFTALLKTHMKQKFIPIRFTIRDILCTFMSNF